MSKYNVGLRALLLQGLSGPEFCGDLVYRFGEMVGKNDFPCRFREIIVRYRRVGCGMNVGPIRLAALLASLVARRWVGLRTE